MKPFGKFALTSLLALGLAASSIVRADDETSAQGAAFSGKVNAVDKSANTVTVNNKTYQLLPTTQINRLGKSSDAQDIKVGEELSGRYKKSAEGKMELLSLNLSGRAKEKETASNRAERNVDAREAGPNFSGKVTAVNRSANTVTVNRKTYNVLPTTQIVRLGRPANIKDIKVGEELSGVYKNSSDGKMELLSLNLSGRAKDATGGSKDTAETSEAGAAFSGKVAKADASSQTLTIGKRTFQALPTTQITRNGAPASFNDIKNGEQVSGNYKKSTEGKMELLSLRIGEKDNAIERALKRD
jgi:ribosomal protein S1